MVNAVEADAGMVKSACDSRNMKRKKLFRCMPVFVALCVLFEGVFFMAITKPGHVPDVWAHVYRIDSILNGDMIARPVTSRSMLHNTATGVVGGAVDRNWMQYSLEQYDGYDPTVVISDTVAEDKSSATVDLPFNNTATNSPIVYAPQLSGFALGRLFGLGPGATYRLAEACMLIVYALIMFCSVRALPKWRIPIGLLLCVPQMLRFASFSISADSFTQAMVILFSCLLFREIVGRRSRRNAIMLAVAGVVLAMCKFVYMPLVLLVVPLMFDRVAGRWRVNRAQAAPLSACVVLSGGWIMFWLSANGWYTNCPMLVSYEQMSERKHVLLTDPAAISEVVKNIVWSIAHAQSNMNNRNGSIGIAACWSAIVVSIIMLAVASMLKIIARRRRHVARPTDDSKGMCDRFSLPYAWLVIALCVGDVLLIYLALWLQYDADGVIGVDGIQYRYFLPYAPLFAFVMLESGKRLLNGSFRNRHALNSASINAV